MFFYFVPQSNGVTNIPSPVKLEPIQLNGKDLPMQVDSEEQQQSDLEQVQTK